MSLPLQALDSRVELRELLGEGGMGEVHAAWDRSLQRAVAVKFIRGSDPRDAERLLLEARLQARVESPHVVRVFEVGALGGRPCILLQLVPGRTLDVLAAELSLVDRVELVRQAATGLHAAHQQGLAHRDVKPGNILVETAEDGTRVAYLTDFGLAHAEEGGLTRSGLLPGTLDFMAPEQLAGGGPVDFRSDIYALGATLYAVLAGRPPFRIPSAEPDQSGEGQVRLLHRILNEEPPPLASLAPGLARELAVIAARAMEKEPAARYPSALAFAEDLERFQRGEPIRARPPTAGERLGTWVRRNRTASRAIAAALAVLLAAGALALWQARQAGLDALEAARLGAVASSLESRLRMEYLAPPHDLRPALAAVKAEVEELRPLARQRRGGPASYALGKGLELTGDLDGARAAYERAWALGFRTPQTAEGLGTVLARIYQREYALASRALAPEARARHLTDLDRTLQAPARRYLGMGEATGWRGPFLEAQTALLQGDFAGARARAADTLRIDAGRYEAKLLEGEAWLLEAGRLGAQDHVAEAAAAVARAVPALEAGLVAGRSDPRGHRLVADALGQRVAFQGASGEETEEFRGRAEEAYAKAATLDADDPALLLGHGRMLRNVVRYEARAFHRSALELSTTAETLLRNAARLAPADPEPLVELALTLNFRSTMILNWTATSAVEVAEAGAEAAHAALALAPGRPDVVRARATTLLGLAAAQQSQGKDARPALEELEARCHEAEALDPSVAGALRQILVVALGFRAREDWRRGVDPRPALERGAALAEQMLGTATGRLSAAAQAGGHFADFAMALMDMGQDAKAPIRRALDLAEESLAQHPELANVQYRKAQMLVLEARRLVLAGLDPSPALAEARRLIASASAGGASLSFLAETTGLMAQFEAWWLAAGHGDPTDALDRCDRAFEKASQGREGPAGLAACALERASWLARRSNPAAATVARRGLEHVRRAREVDSLEPGFLLLEARLRGLLGDREGGRIALAAAFVAQPLLRGARDAHAAEAELR